MMLYLDSNFDMEIWICQQPFSKAPATGTDLSRSSEGGPPYSLMRQRRALKSLPDLREGTQQGVL